MPTSRPTPGGPRHHRPSSTAATWLCASPEILLGIGGCAPARPGATSPPLPPERTATRRSWPGAHPPPWPCKSRISFAEARTLTIGATLYPHTPCRRASTCSRRFHGRYFGPIISNWASSATSSCSRPAAGVPPTRISPCHPGPALSERQRVSKRHGEVAREMWRELWPAPERTRCHRASPTVCTRTPYLQRHGRLAAALPGAALGEQPEIRALGSIDRIPTRSCGTPRPAERLVAVPANAGRALAHHGALATKWPKVGVLHPEVRLGFARRLATYSAPCCSLRSRPPGAHPQYPQSPVHTSLRQGAPARQSGIEFIPNRAHGPARGPEAARDLFGRL